MAPVVGPDPSIKWAAHVSGPLLLTLSQRYIQNIQNIHGPRSMVRHLEGFNAPVDDDSNACATMEHPNFTVEAVPHEATEASLHTETARPAEQKSTSPQKPKVVVSERRRLQNRQAQKLYRLKQKQRVQALESLVGSQTLLPQDSAISYASLLGNNGHVGGTSSEAMQMSGVALPGSVPNQDASFHAQTSFSQRLKLDERVIYGGSTRRFENPLCPYAELGEQAMLPYTPDTVETSYNSAQQAAAACPCKDSISPENFTADASSAGLLSQTLSLSLSLVYEMREKGAALDDILKMGLRCLEQRSLDTGEDAVQEPLDESLIQQRGQSQLPDLRVNTIRLTQMSFISAMINNAALLGLTADQMYANDTNSPFYSAVGAQDTAADGCQDLPAVLKRDLKPTPNQLSFRHHPFIDALPFPTFRERVIAILQANPPILDQKELCHDLQNGGIVCWGSSLGAGVGNSGAPWDIRSWEARPWFMKKWWMLTGGTEAEMSQQTRWWCEMRGDGSTSPW